MFMMDEYLCVSIEEGVYFGGADWGLRREGVLHFGGVDWPFQRPTIIPESNPLLTHG